MELLKFTHDVHDLPKTRELFGLVGEFCVDPVIRAELGAPISSAAGDTWLVAKDGEAVQGFCVISMQKNGKAKLHALYAPTAALSGSLRRAATKEAKGAGAKAITYTVPAAQAEAMKKDGWTEGVARGQYLAFEKEF